MLALIAFVVGVLGALYLYLHVYSETLRAPVLSAYAVSCHNATHVIAAITVRHERGDPISLRRVTLVTEVGALELYPNAPGGSVVSLVGFGGSLGPGQSGRILVEAKWGSIPVVENKTYNTIIEFDKVTGIASFTVVSCESLRVPEWQRVLRMAPPIRVSPANATPGLCLVTKDRRALAYTDFEELPSNWRYRGGWSWDLVAGFKGRALRGADNNGGIGGASQYYWDHNLSGYSPLWISVKVRGAGGEAYRGLYLLSSDLRRLYEVSLYNGFLYVRGYDGRWYEFLHVMVEGYNLTSWYIILVYSEVKNSTAGPLSVRVLIYDMNGDLKVNATAEIAGARFFVPAYVGVGLDCPRAPGLCKEIYGIFEDFVVSLSDPRYLHVVNLVPGTTVVALDSFGNTVSSAIAEREVLYMNVLIDIVLGNGTGLLIIESKEFSCKYFGDVVGGDLYRVLYHITPIVSVVGERGLFAYVRLELREGVIGLPLLYVKPLQSAYVRLVLIDYVGLEGSGLTSALTLAVAPSGVIIEEGRVVTNATSPALLRDETPIVITAEAPPRNSLVLYLMLESSSYDNAIFEPIPIILELLSP